MNDINTQKIEWIHNDGLVAYEDALTFMEQRVASIIKGEANEAIWLLEHPSLYTAGTSAKPEHLLTPNNFPVYTSGRGGQYTYHGPGQRIAYVMLDLNKRGQDVRKFITSLEDWVIAALGDFNVSGTTHSDRVGIWVDRSKELGTGREDKIAAIGIRLRRWVSFHGISINVDPNLEHFGGIVPCGIADQKLGVTSLTNLGLPVSMTDLDIALKAHVQVLNEES